METGVDEREWHAAFTIFIRDVTVGITTQELIGIWTAKKTGSSSRYF